MAKIIAIIVIVVLLAAGIWWWLDNRAPSDSVPVDISGTAPASDETAAIANDLNAAAVADIDAEFGEIDRDLNSL